MSTKELIKVDILIIGGSIQGLWLLNDLRELGYSTLLLTKGALGDGQTLHSQLRVQGGHQVGTGDEELIQACRESSSKFWQKFIKDHPQIRAMEDSPMLFRFRDGQAKKVRTEFCHRKNLSWEPNYINPSIDLGGIPLVDDSDDDLDDKHLLCNSQETWLNGFELMSVLSKNVREQIFQGTINQIRLNEQNEIDEVSVQIHDAEYNLQPKLLILAAGQGNVPILNSAWNDDQWRNKLGITEYNIKNYNVIVAKGNLRPLTGFFQFKKPIEVTIFSRQCDNNEIAWLLPVQDDEYGEKTSKSIEHLEHFLNQLYPNNTIPDQLKVGMYSGKRVEVITGGSTKHFIRRYNNVITIWPNWLTLAPLASQSVIEQIKTMISQGNPLTFNAPKHSGEIAPESWTMVQEWRDWQTFQSLTCVEELRSIWQIEN